MEPLFLLIPQWMADTADVREAIAALKTDGIHVDIANVFVDHKLGRPPIQLEQWLAGKR